MLHYFDNDGNITDLLKCNNCHHTIYVGIEYLPYIHIVNTFNE